VSSVSYVTKGQAQTGSEPVSPHPIEDRGHVLRPGEALLDGHDEGEDGLALGHSPERCLHCGDLGEGAGDPGEGPVVGSPTPALVDAHSFRTHDA